METYKKGGQTRSINWTTDEKELLFELVAEKVDILENKQNDANASRKKTAAWKEVYKKFIARFPDRSLARLKEQWKRLKGVAKTEYSVFTRGQRGTGGGPPPLPPSELSSKIKDLLPREFTQLSNRYDDDADSQGNSDDTCTSQAETVDSR